MKIIQLLLLSIILTTQVFGQLRGTDQDGRKLSHISIYPGIKIKSSKNSDGCIVGQYGDDGVPEEGDLIELGTCGNKPYQKWDIMVDAHDDIFQMQQVYDGVAWCADLGNIDRDIVDPTRMRIGRCTANRHQDFRFTEPVPGLQNAITPKETEGDLCITALGFNQDLGKRMIAKECVFSTGNSKKRFQWIFQPSIPGF